MQPEAFDQHGESFPEKDGDAPPQEGPVFATIDALVGTKLDQYLIKKEIGRGAMGVVFEATDTDSDRKVALKILPPNISLSDKVIRRFLREAESVAKLDHPNIVKIHGIGHRESIYYYAMDIVEGRPLDEVLADENPLPFQRTVQLIIQACDAVQFAHVHEIIHRDIKPGNILVSAGDMVTITDFGLARQEKAATLTESGALVGTPIYMSPEQVIASRGGVDKRTDIYSLGVTLYQLLTGEPPFQAESTQKILNQILEKDPLPPHRRRKQVPQSLSIITLKAMEKNPSHRFQTAEEMGDELRRYLSGASIRSRPAGLMTLIGKRVKKHKIISTLIIVSFLLLIGFSTNLIRFSREIEQMDLEMTEVKLEKEKTDTYAQKIEFARTLLAHPGVGMNIPAAIGLLEEAVALIPEEPIAHILLGKANAYKRDLGRAFQEFMLAVNHAPESGEAHLERARFLLEEGTRLRTDGAENAIALAFLDLQKAMELDAQNPTIPYYMAKTLYTCSEAEDLTFEQQRTIITWAYQAALRGEALGATADLYCLLAQIHIKLSNYATMEAEKRSTLEEAHLALIKALDLDGNHLLAARLLEELEKRMEEPGLGSGEISAREMVEEQGMGNFISKAADIYGMLKNDIETTITDAKESEIVDSLIQVLISPDRPADSPGESQGGAAEEASLDEAALIEKAEGHLDREEYAEAVRCYKRALIFTKPADAHELNYRIAEAYMLMSNKEGTQKALSHARLSYSQEPRNPQYLILLAITLDRLKDEAGLERLYKEAIENKMMSFFPILDLPFFRERKAGRIPR